MVHVQDNRAVRWHESFSEAMQSVLRRSTVQSKHRFRLEEAGLEAAGTVGALRPGQDHFIARHFKRKR